MLHNWVSDKRRARGELPVGRRRGEEHRARERVAFDTSCPRARQRKKGAKATKRQGQIVETTTEARQGEPGPSVVALLIISTGLAILILGVVWYAFFRT